ncbi:MAG: DctP family TRAP transporter solute-binding subunit [Desulfovibrio sp.]|nr:DctP family TRAP transporter solute-binding subunit [Desulfovibrio sp.]
MPRILSFLCAVFLTLATAQFSFAAPIVLKLGHIAEPENPYGQGADHFAKLVKERSNGAIEIKVYPSSQLGNQRDLVEGLTLGTVEMTLTGTAVLGNFVPEVSIFDLPFLFRDVQHAYKALDTIGMALCNKGQNRGMITLAIWENGVRHMTNNVHPIVTPNDMKGLKFRVMEQPVYIAMMKALGASPTPMAMSELYTALQKGVIDGQENPLAHIATKRFFEVQKFLSLTGHTYAPEPVLISVAAWKKLSPDQQALIKKAAEDTRDWQRQLCRDMEGKFLKVIKDSGKCQVNDNVDKKAFAEATRKVWDLYIKRFGDANIKAIVAIQ